MNKPAIYIILSTISVVFLSWNFLIPGDENNAQAIPDIKPAELKPGGDTTVSIKPAPSLMLPANNLAIEKKPDFHAGKALAHQPWVKAPTITDARDGLGPVYNTRTCLVCHANGGRGHMPTDNQQLLFTNFLRLSIPGFDPVHGVIAEPMYGDQLQSQSVALSHQLRAHIDKDSVKKEVPPEGYVFINWHKKTFTYPDGQTANLRKPEIDIQNLGYGEMHPDTLMGIRNAPPIHGVGLLELIKQADIDKNADPEDNNKDGISGRINTVWDFEKNQPTPGRFGLKANKASVRFQVAAALQGDMGITSSVFPTQPCTEKQTLCNATIDGNDKQTGIEISDKLLALMVNFNFNIGVPERRKPNHPMVLQGRELFYLAQCNACHTPSYVTGTDEAFPHLSQQEIWPYTDLLLHDMGEGLADGRPDYLASGSEWRTAPLWSVGLSQAVNGSKNFLHDGRARNIEEAILWHGGEAQNSTDYFVNLSKDQRLALMAFVRSL